MTEVAAAGEGVLSAIGEAEAGVEEDVDGAGSDLDALPVERMVSLQTGHATPPRASKTKMSRSRGFPFMNDQRYPSKTERESCLIRQLALSGEE